MSKKTRSRDSNSKAEAKRQDDWWFHEEPLNTPDTMDMCVITKIRGCFKDNLFYLRILVILSALSIGLQTSRMVENTSGESTFGPNESLELQLKTSQGEELQLKVTGKNTTEALMNLMKNASGLEILPINERLFPYTPQKGELILRRQDNSLSIPSFPRA